MSMITITINVEMVLNVALWQATISVTTMKAGNIVVVFVRMVNNNGTNDWQHRRDMVEVAATQW